MRARGARAHAGRPIWREEKARVFRSAAGVLNTLHPAEVIGVNARLFEAAGCGAAVLTEFRPSRSRAIRHRRRGAGVPRLRRARRSGDRLLSEAGLTARLGDAAARRAHRDHTYDRGSPPSWRRWHDGFDHAQIWRRTPQMMSVVVFGRKGGGAPVGLVGPVAPDYLADKRARAIVTPLLAIGGFTFAATRSGPRQTLATADRPTVAVVWGGVALAAYAASLLCLIGGQRAGLGLARWKVRAVDTALVRRRLRHHHRLTWGQPQTTGIAAEIAVSSVLRALWLVAVGMTAWALGYWIGPGQATRGLAARVMGTLRRRFAAEVRSPAAPWILYAIGIAARLASTATTGRFGNVGDASSAVSTASGYGGILGALTLCAPLGVAAAALLVFRERLPGARITLAVLFVIELAFGAAAGGKESFVIAVLAVAIPFSAAHRRLPKAMLIASILIFLVVVVPFNQAYRGAVRQGSVTLTPRQAVSAAPGILRQAVTGHSVDTILPELRRLSGAEDP